MEEGALAVVPAVENGYAIGTDLGRLDALADLGARYLTLTHNGHNALGDAAIPRPDLGDGDAARRPQRVRPRGDRRLNRLGMLVDVAHAAKSTMMQAVSLSHSPSSRPTPASTRSARTRATSTTSSSTRWRRRRRRADHRGAGVPPRQRQGSRGRARRFRRPHRLRGEAHRHRPCRHLVRLRRRRRLRGWHDAAESPNITAELLRRGYDGRRSPRSGAAISCARCARRNAGGAAE